MVRVWFVRAVPAFVYGALLVLFASFSVPTGNKKNSGETEAYGGRVMRGGFSQAAAFQAS